VLDEPPEITEPVAEPVIVPAAACNGHALETTPDRHSPLHTPKAATALILKSLLSPGDIVVMTAAVRELHRQYPGQYVTDVRTSAREIWEHNPFITPLDEHDPEVRTIELHYPLINQSNQRPVHFLEGYCEDLANQLGLASLRPQEFCGRIYLTELEQGWMNQVEETSGYRGPFWLINAGAKRDYTCKQWPTEYYQAVVDYFRGRIVFVQIGAEEHQHPALQNVIDLRGQTNHRQLIRLVYHASGVLTGVSYPMHLAAAVPCGPLASRAGTARLRPCVVVNGGREPPHWEQYPGHQFLHTIGALKCCATGGCWQSRVVPLGDGDRKDRDLCEQPQAGYPRCMWLIQPIDVVRAIERYLCLN
jgi:ADP-heptose:LPS heptosyltransferase